MRLACAMLFVKNLPQMRAFYTSMLGSEAVNTQWTETWALFETGGAQLALHVILEEAARGIEIASPPQAREQSAVKLIFQVRRYAGGVRAAGIDASNHAATAVARSGGVAGAHPEGNVFQIAKSQA